MSHEPSTPAPRGPRTRWVALRLAYLVFLVGLLELGSWSYLALTGRGLDLEQEVAVILGQADEDRTPLGQARPGAGTIAAEELHPYLGFTPTLNDTGAPGNELYQIWQERLFEPGSPLFSEDPNDLVIGLTGGSVAQQFGKFGGAKQLAKLLSQTPRFGGRKVRFVGVAFGGAKQPQQLMGLTYLLTIGGRLDLLINLDGFNEVALHESDNQPQGVAPVYPRSWFHRVGRSETMLLVGQRRLVQEERGQLLQDMLDSPVALSGLRRVIWVLKDDALAHQLQQLGEELRSFDAIADSRKALGPRPATDPAVRLEELVGIWQRSSLQMANLCAANGIEYYHFLQPNQYVEGSKVLSAEELETAYLPGSGYSAQAPDGYLALQAAAPSLVAAGVRYHDLTGIYRDVEETIYKDNCCHVNELGNALLAEAMREAIVSWGD